ncbi:hypothetical protein B0H15DRAFT_215417 [Mycena belliarum]|uniref:Hyaluronan/mRNA-binding protein domain-containing protein n=1 Tax=Mycena belliarum TaxID=1033014 RepID=A0AAD6XXU1_9AGAR|nr:hypothetical protein B0H15DRAFT_215417 [Mycena belliae]
MSVATKNPFALLEADDSSRPSSPVPAKAAPAAPVPAAPPRGAQKPRGGPAARGGKYYARGAAKAGARTDDGAGNLNQNGIEDAPQDRKFDGRGRGRGARGGARGGRGGRQFDKHSQTGKVDSEKKVNQGWGADEGTAELKAEQAAVSDANAEAAPAGGEWGATAAGASEWDAPAGNAEWTAPAGDAAAADAEGAAKPEREGRPPRREREPEEEDNTLTLEQYLAQQKDKDSLIPKIEAVRQANEGADADLWKGAVALDKGEEDAYFVGKSKSAPKARTKKEEKVFLEIEARFERPSRGGPRGRGGDDRGGRGRGVARGRGGPRGRPAGGAPAVNVDDEKAFPSLS